MIEDIKGFAKANKIPIMEEEGILFLTKYIKENKISSILEIGTAIGYSSIKMALVDKDIKIVTLERDVERYRLAQKNINDLNLSKQIEVINEDALEYTTSSTFDLIFIDAAKSQSLKFFEKFKNNLNNKGTIITDNIYFHGLTYSSELLSRNLRGMTRKIREYVEFLKNNEEFETEILNIGDGLAVSKRRKV